MGGRVGGYAAAVSLVEEGMGGGSGNQVRSDFMDCRAERNCAFSDGRAAARTWSGCERRLLRALEKVSKAAAMGESAEGGST